MEGHIERENSLAQKVHANLAHSYFFYFVFLVFGVILDIIVPLKIFEHRSSMPIGFLFLILATGLILWAQYTTRDLHNKNNLDKESFKTGPYRFTKTPTHWGLALLTLGFGIVANAIFVVATTIISFLISKLYFLKKYNSTLEEKYGQAYIDYRRDVRL